MVQEFLRSSPHKRDSQAEIFGRVVARGSGVNGIVQAGDFREVPEHHAQVPDVG